MKRLYCRCDFGTVLRARARASNGDRGRMNWCTANLLPPARRCCLCAAATAAAFRSGNCARRLRVRVRAGASIASDRRQLAPSIATIRARNLDFRSSRIVEIFADEPLCFFFVLYFKFAIAVCSVVIQKIYKKLENFTYNFSAEKLSARSGGGAGDTSARILASPTSAAAATSAAPPAASTPARDANSDDSPASSDDAQRLHPIGGGGGGGASESGDARLSSPYAMAAAHTAVIVDPQIRHVKEFWVAHPILNVNI